MQWRERFRYGPIALLAVGTALFAIGSKDGPAQDGVVIGLTGLMLFIAAITSRRAPAARRRSATAAVALMATLAVLSAVDVIGPTAASAAAGAFATATVVAVADGLIKLLRTHGVTIQAVAGGLAIYALIGLVFAFIIDIVASAPGKPYFANGSDGTLGEHVYYSFTIITTTGLGDFVPARNGGRMLAACEMLFGQIYLVTVVALLVSNVRRSKAS
jgi:hypothetical protein